MSRLAAVAWAGALATILHDQRTVPSLAPVHGADPAPVSVIVPARDEEASIEATLRALAPQAAQVIAIDDESRDGTRAAMARVAGVEVVDGAPPPPGWLGKPWACDQGVRRATEPWVLFVDADVRLAPGAVAALVAFAEAQGAEGATAFPFLDTGTVAERIVLPVAGVAMQTAIIPSWAARSPWTDVAIGVGGCLLLRRSLYDAIGGHAALRGEVVDDLGLARAAKRAGHLLPWARGERLLRLRYYRGARDMWQGWRKNASHAWRGPWFVGLIGGGLVQALLLAPWVSLARGRGSGALTVALQVAAIDRVIGGTDIPRGYALAGPAGALFLAGVGLQAVVDRARGRAQWRGRAISMG